MGLPISLRTLPHATSRDHQHKKEIFLDLPAGGNVPIGVNEAGLELRG